MELIEHLRVYDELGAFHTVDCADRERILVAWGRWVKDEIDSVVQVVSPFGAATWLQASNIKSISHVTHEAAVRSSRSDAELGLMNERIDKEVREEQGEVTW